MEQLKKCGQVWVKFDENGELEYGFIVEGRDIQRLIMMSDKKIDTFVLPNLGVGPDKFVNKQGLIEYKENFLNKKETPDYYYDYFMKKYLCGSAKICSGCFKDIRSDFKVVVPSDYSIMIDHGAFERGSNVKFVLKEGLNLFQVNRSFSTPFDYEHEWWHIIGHDVLEGMPEVGGNEESFSFKKYDSKQSCSSIQFDRPTFEVVHPKSKILTQDGGKQ